MCQGHSEGLDIAESIMMPLIVSSRNADLIGLNTKETSLAYIINKVGDFR